MTPSLLCQIVIRPVLAHLAWPQPWERELLLCAIALQESGLKYRRQMPSGPGRSWWQIEPATALDCIGRCPPVQDLCIAIDQGYDTSDHAACAIAAGILRLHPGRLPEVGELEKAWKYYVAAWRPGAPRPDSWPKAYREALSAAATPDP